MGRVRLSLEEFELRTVPATFTWNATDHGDWEDPDNWDGPADEYPNGEDDIAEFDLDESNASVVINGPITLQKILTRDGYWGHIQLKDTLTLTGAGIDGSELDSPVSIDPQDSDANLKLTGATLEIRQGTIGSTIHKSKLIVEDESLLTFNLTSPVSLGMDLEINSPDFTSRVVVKNASAFNAHHLTLTNQANIFVNDGSRLYLNGVNGGGWILNQGAQSGYIKVGQDGAVSRGGYGEAQVHLPIRLINGSLWIGEHLDVLDPSTHLNIRSNGTAETNYASLYAEDYSSIWIGPNDVANWARSTQLSVIDDMTVTGNSNVYARGSNATINANEVAFDGGSHLGLGTNKNNTQYYTKLTFNLDGEDEVVKFTSVNVYLDMAAGGTNYSKIDIDGGALEIDGKASHLYVTMHGNEEPDEVYDLFTVEGGITGDFGENITTTGAFFDIEILQPGGPATYRFTTIEVD